MVDGVTCTWGYVMRKCFNKGLDLRMHPDLIREGVHCVTCTWAAGRPGRRGRRGRPGRRVQRSVCVCV